MTETKDDQGSVLQLQVAADDMGKIIGIRNGRKLLEEIPNKIQTNLGFLANIHPLKHSSP